MGGRSAIVRMIPLLPLILCFATPQVSAFPLKRCTPELLISPDDIILNGELKKEMLLVDIRPSAEFQRLRIPGSLNFPIYAIKAKTFLKKYDLVAIDEGYRYAQIEGECRHLKREGFRLRILSGGLSTWNRKGGALEGDALARKSLNKLSPLNFFPENDHANWIILDVSDGKRLESACPFLQAISIPFTKDSAGFVARYQELLKNEITGPCSRILVADERGEHYEPLERILRMTAFPDVFFLKDGIEGYLKFVDGMNSMGKRRSTAMGKACCRGGP